MKRGLKWLGGLVVQNLGWKVLSLATAFTIWALVATEPELNTVTPVQLEYRNVPDDLEISSEPVSIVRLELRGPSGALRDLGVNGVARPSIVLDMSSVQQGQRTFTIGDGAVKLARGLRLVRAIPSEVRFEFERRAARSVPVSVRFAGQGDNGYVVSRYDVSPKVARIVGPSSHVSRITAVTTDPVDVSTVVGSSEFHVNAFLSDDFVRFQSPPLITVTVTMKRKNE
jgi:YbbR domain-containing protein